eukprot:EG_transcript_1059
MDRATPLSSVPALHSLGSEGRPRFGRVRPAPAPRWHCSLSIPFLVLSPTAGVMAVVALTAWLLIHNSATTTVEAVGHQGQQMFVMATRDSILAYMASVQHIHRVNRPRWQNTSCDGTPKSRNGSAFDAYEDVRLALWSHVHYLQNGNWTVAVAFPLGSFLGYQRTTEGYSWVVVDESTKFGMRKIKSETWQDGWANGSSSWTNPLDLMDAGLPVNMSTRVWFSNAVARCNQSWSVVYYSLPMEALAITAVMPVYHPDGQLKLVAEVELSLQQVGSFFTRLKLTPNTFAFVVDMAGNLVASNPEGLATAIDAQHTPTGAVDTLVAAQRAGDARIAAAAAWLVAQFGAFSTVPTEDSNFEVQLDGVGHYLFTGHVNDTYGLHWVIVIGLPRSDFLLGLDGYTIGAILTIAATLLASTLVIAALTVIVRRNLHLFARRIKLMGAMDLEGAKQIDGLIFMSEARLILVNLRQTIENLSQFRAFLPPTMLDKVRQAGHEATEEAEEGDGGETPACPVLSCAGRADPPPGGPPPAGGAARPRTEGATSPQPPLLLISPDGSLQSEMLHSPQHQPHLPHRPPSMLQSLLERHMEHLAVTVATLELPNLHSPHQPWNPADLMRWYEVCLSTALGVIHKWNGDFYRLSGDQLLFSWGAMRRVAAQCSKACHAAWHLSQALREIDAKEAHPVNFSPRISVVTGTALCGVMGTNPTRDLYLVGPLVKQGAHLASLNGSYGTHILVDAAVAEQCNTLFRLRVCGLVHNAAARTSQPVQPVYEMLSHVPENTDMPRCKAEEEWMYRLTSPTDSRSRYQLAMESLARGSVQEARQDLEAYLSVAPADRHARRILARLLARPSDTNGFDDLVD